MRRIITATVAAALLMAAAGCGGGSGVVTAPNTPKQIAADNALAKRAVLKLGDLPAGYKGNPHDNSSSGDIPPAVVTEFATCLHVPRSEIAGLLSNKHDPGEVSVDAPDFDLRSGLARSSFQNNVSIERSSNDIKKPFNVLGPKSALPCWKNLFQAALEQTAPKGASVRGLTVTALPTGPVGDEAAAFDASVTLMESGVSIPVYLDFYFVGRGRAGMSLFASGIGHRVDGNLERSLVKTVFDRLDAVT